MSGPDDAALIWDDHRPPRPGGRRTRRQTAPSVSPEVPPDPAPKAPEEPRTVAAEGRLTLREAADRYGVSPSTLGSWCRSAQIDGVLADGPSGRRWMVSPASVAERVATGRSRQLEPGVAGADPGAMLVPRDAWEKLMDQLGNLHEAGQQLAEARERAARYETEAAFLRERLAELRAERDALRTATEPAAADGPEPPWRDRVRRWWSGSR